MSEAPKREQKGGVIYEDGRPVGYTKEGAQAAVEGGPVDSTVQPDFLVNDLEQHAPAPTETLTPKAPAETADADQAGISREDAAPLTSSTRRRASS